MPEFLGDGSDSRGSSNSRTDVREERKILPLVAGRTAIGMLFVASTKV